METPATFEADAPATDSPASFQPEPSAVPASFRAEAPSSFTAEPATPTIPHAQPGMVSTTAGGTRGGGLRWDGFTRADVPDLADVAEVYRDVSRPAVALPRIPIAPDDHPITAVGKEAVNILIGIPEFMTSPLGIGSAGAGSVIPRTVAGAFSADMLHSLGQQVTSTYQNWAAMSPTEKAVAVTDIAGTGAFATLTGAHAAGVKFKAQPKPVAEPPPETFSEFGGEAPKPAQPTTFTADASGTVRPANAPLDAQPAVQTPEAPAARPTNPASSTEAESGDTLAAQMKWLKEGKRPAVLFTHPEQTIPEFFKTEADGQFGVRDTAAGRFLYDTSQLTGDAIDQAVANNQVGHLLGYGIADKPAPGTEVGAVVIRDGAGREKQAVVTDAANLANVFAASQRLVSEGDSVRLETPEQVVAARQQAAAPKATPMSEQQRMARETERTMAELRAARAAKATPPPAEPSDEPAASNQQPATKLVPVEVTPAEYSAARQGLRVGERIPVATAVASDAKRAQLFADTAFAERPNQTEPLPAHQLFVGDEFKLNGQRVRVTDQVMDAETGQPSHLEVDGAYGPQTIPFNELVHIDKGSMTSGWETKLDSLKLDTNGQLHAFGLAPLVWNALIDGVKLSVRGGMALKDAIEAALAKLKASGTVPNEFDEAGARAHLGQLSGNAGELPPEAIGLRRFPGVLEQLGSFSPEVLAGITERTYKIESDAGRLEVADGIIQEMGYPAAFELYTKADARVLPESFREVLGVRLAETAAAKELAARQAGDAATSAQWVNYQRQILNQSAKASSATAQALQARKTWYRLTPTAKLAEAQEIFDRAARSVWATAQPAVDLMVQGIRDSWTATRNAVVQHREVNAAARAAVDANIRGSEATRQAVIMELAQPWASAPEIVQMARDQVQAKANDLLNKSPRPPGLTAQQHLRQILDDIATRAAGIFSSHMQGAEPGVPIVDKLMQRLGLDRPHAVKLATAFSKEWDRQLELAKSKLDKKLINQRARQLKGLDADATDGAVDRAIRAQLRELNQRLGQIVRQAATARDATGQHIADRILQASGLKGAEAEQLRTTIKTVWERTLKERAAAELAKLAPHQQRILKPKGVMDKLLEAANLGALDSEAAYGLVREKLKLPTFTPELQNEFLRWANEIQSIPADQLHKRFKAETELLTWLVNRRGVKCWRDILPGLFYNGMLSNPMTHGRNLGFTGLLGIADAGVAWLHAAAKGDPGAALAIIKGAKDGIYKGLLLAVEEIKTGAVSKTGEKIENPRAFNAFKFEGELSPLNVPLFLLRSPTKFLQAEDLLWFKPNEDIKWQLVARKVAREQGLRGEQLNREVDRLLARAPERIQAAVDQAHNDGYAPGSLDFRLRVIEILNAAREANLPNVKEDAIQYALRNTLNEEPYGPLGYLVGKYNEATTWMYENHPAGGVVMDWIIPFRRIVVNMLNESMNWTPIGTARAWRANKTGKLFGNDTTDADAVNHLFTKSLVGTTALAGLFALAQNGTIQIYGLGPTDKDKRAAWKNLGGHVSSSIKIGNYSQNYLSTPLGFPLAAMGNYFDAIRYRGLDEQDAMNRLAFALQSTGRAWLDQNFLSSAQGFLEGLAQGSVNNAPNKLLSAAARPVSATAIPGKGFLQFLDRAFDPQVYSASDVRGALVSQVPFLRRDGQPTLNAVGLPIQAGLTDNDFKLQTPEPLWRILDQKNAWYGQPERKDVFIGEKAKGEGYYRPISEGEYYQFIAETGQQIHEALNDDLDKIIFMTPAEAQRYVQNTVQHIRLKALKEISE